uniref:Uncharacterized protein n=1 Tax=Branchiostoma floridae TaxID=7739 RepID=C3Y891_BRAFL|eukprot:XP_002607550.1 hypothetical protein BRAFLDRAFT_106499 [Branchiostoma floridae]
MNRLLKRADTDGDVQRETDHHHKADTTADVHTVVEQYAQIELLCEHYADEVEELEEVESKHSVLAGVLKTHYNDLTTTEVLRTVLKVHGDTMPNLAKLAAAAAVIPVSTAGWRTGTSAPALEELVSTSLSTPPHPTPTQTRGFHGAHSAALHLELDEDKATRLLLIPCESIAWQGIGEEMILAYGSIMQQFPHFAWDIKASKLWRLLLAEFPLRTHEKAAQFNREMGDKKGHNHLPVMKITWDNILTDTTHIRLYGSLTRTVLQDRESHVGCWPYQRLPEEDRKVELKKLTGSEMVKLPGSNGNARRAQIKVEGIQEVWRVAQGKSYSMFLYNTDLMVNLSGRTIKKMVMSREEIEEVRRGSRQSLGDTFHCWRTGRLRKKLLGGHNRLALQQLRQDGSSRPTAASGHTWSRCTVTCQNTLAKRIGILHNDAKFYLPSVLKDHLYTFSAALSAEAGYTDKASLATVEPPKESQGM